MDTKEDNVDVTGTSGIESESELENLLALTPIQCPSPDKKNKKQSKKNLPSILNNKINQSHGTKTKKKIHSELNQDGKMSQSQDVNTNKKRQPQGVKGKKKITSQATKDIKSDHNQATQGYKKKKTPKVISNINKKNPLNDCENKHNTCSNVQLKKKKVFAKISSSSSSKQVRNHSLVSLF